MRQVRYTFGLICVGFLISAGALDAQEASLDARQVFVKANELYREGRHDEAIESYENIVDHGLASGPLYYNLGNAYFKTGQIGRTVLNYERARRFLPRDSDLKANARYVRSFIQNSGGSAADSFWERRWKHYARSGTTGELEGCVLILFAAMGIFHILGLYRDWPRRRIAVIIALLGLLLIAGGGLLGTKIQMQKNAAVLLSDTAIRFEPSKEGTVHFELSEGAQVKVLDQEDNWLKVRRRDGKIGWVPEQNIERI